MDIKILDIKTSKIIDILGNKFLILYKIPNG